MTTNQPQNITHKNQPARVMDKAKMKHKPNSKQKKICIFAGLSALAALLIIAAVLVLSDNLTGKAGNQLTPDQTQAYWQCMADKGCSTLLKEAKISKNYTAYRKCAQDCMNAALQFTSASLYCNDADGKDFLAKGKVFTNFLPQGKEDYCFKFPSGKTYLMEGVCKDNKYTYLQKSCTEINKDFICSGGVCKDSGLKLLYGNGNPKNLNMVVVQYNFSESEQQSGKIEKQLETIFYGSQNSPLYADKSGFFNITPIAQNKNKINVYLIKKDASSACGQKCLIDDKIAFAKQGVPWLNLSRDILIIFNNKKESAGYTVAGEEKVIILSQNTKTQTFSHEFGHAFAELTEEYFWYPVYFNSPNGPPYDAGVKQEGWGSSNCDFHKKPEMWCNKVNDTAYDDFLVKAELSQSCFEAIDEKNENWWYENCPKLKLSSFWGEEKEEKYCSDFSALLQDNLKYWSCSKSTLEPLKYANFGIECKPGHGYYFGCGAGVNAFRSVPFSIMGCGDADDCLNIYGYANEKGEIIAPPLYPQEALKFSPPASEAIEQKFMEYG